MSDLIREDRYDDVVGAKLLNWICCWTVRNNIVSKDVNVFMASSSSMLLKELEYNMGLEVVGNL